MHVFRDIVSEILIGVDLAISKNETADYTSIVVVALCYVGDKPVFYVLANSVNKRMSYPEAIETIKSVAKSHSYGLIPKVVIESNGFQQIYADTLNNLGIDVEAVKNTSDKRTRIASTSYHVQTGVIVFPEKGAEPLTTQLTGFGIENHDDLADAFAIAIIFGIEQHLSMPDIHIIYHDKTKRPPWYFPGDENDPVDSDLLD